MADSRARAVIVGGRKLFIIEHAVERYQERVKPALDRPQALAELRQLLPSATLTSSRPSWVISGAPRPRPEWVVLTDSIVFPVMRGALVTCLTRGEVGTEMRLEHRRERRERRERDRQPGARQKYGKVSRDDRRRRRERAAEAFE